MNPLILCTFWLWIFAAKLLGFSFGGPISTDHSNRYKRLILETSNSPSFTLSSESIQLNEDPPWKSGEFQLMNASQLLSKYTVVSHLPSNISNFISSKGTASLTLVLKGFSHSLLYLNFSYFVGPSEVHSVTTPLPQVLPKIHVQKPSSPSEAPKQNDAEKTEELALAMATEPVTKLLTAATQNLLMITSATQQQSSQNQPKPEISPLVKSPDTPTTTTSHSYSSQHSGAANNVNALINLTLANTSQSTNKEQGHQLNKSINETPASSDASFKNVTKPSNTMKDSNFNEKVNSDLGMGPIAPLGINDTASVNKSIILIALTNSAIITTTTPSPPSISTTESPPYSSTEFIPIIHDMARKRRAVNEGDSVTANPTIAESPGVTTSSGNTVLSPPEEVFLSNSPSQSSSKGHIAPVDDIPSPDEVPVISNDPAKSLSSLALPLAAVQAVQMIKTAAAVAAAAASNAASKAGSSGPATKNAGHTANSKGESGPGKNSKVRENPSFSLTETETNLKNENNIHVKIKETRSHHQHHDHEHNEHHHHKSKNTPSNNKQNTKRKKSNKKAENVERNEKNYDDVGEVSSSSSSSSEEYNDNNAGKQKISYKTWRASLEKRNRPPGLYVTVNDDIIFDNWDGIWDKPYVMGKWTGSKDMPKGQWNHSYIFMNFEDVAASHDVDVKITFEWEPSDDNSLLILSDIVASTVVMPGTELPKMAEKEMVAKVKIDETKQQLQPLPEPEEAPKVMPVSIPENKTAENVASKTQTPPVIVLRQRPGSVKEEWEVISIINSDSNSSLPNTVTTSERETKRLNTSSVKVEKAYALSELEKILQMFPESVKKSILLAVNKTESTTHIPTISNTTPIIPSTTTTVKPEILETGPSIPSSTTTAIPTTSVPSTTSTTTTKATTTASTTTEMTTTSAPTTNKPSTTTTPTTTTPAPQTQSPSTTTTFSTTSSTTTEATTSKPTMTPKPTSKIDKIGINIKAINVIPVTKMKPDDKSALYVTILTGIVAVFLMMFAIWRKAELSLKGRNAVR